MIDETTAGIEVGPGFGAGALEKAGNVAVAGLEVVLEPVEPPGPAFRTPWVEQDQGQPTAWTGFG